VGRDRDIGDRMAARIDDLPLHHDLFEPELGPDGPTDAESHEKNESDG
jgi:hypothetical protein